MGGGIGGLLYSSRDEPKDARHSVVAVAAILTTFRRHEDCPTR